MSISDSDLQLYLMLSWSNAKISRGGQNIDPFVNIIDNFTENFMGLRQAWYTESGKHLYMDYFTSEEKEDISRASLIQRAEPREWGCIKPQVIDSKEECNIRCEFTDKPPTSLCSRITRNDRSTVFYYERRDSSTEGLVKLAIALR